MDEPDSLYRQIVEGSTDGAWIFDQDGRTMFFNTRTAELLGRTSEEMAGLSVFDALDEVGRQQFGQHLVELRAGQHNVYEVECSYLRKDGSRVWVMVSETVIYDADGRASGYCHRLTDFTDRRKLVAELRRSEEQLAEAQAIARTGSWDWDLVTGEVAWSAQMYSLLGLDPEESELTNDSFFAMILEQDRPLVAEAVRRAREKTGEFSYDARARLADDSIVWLRGRIRVIFDDEHNPLRVGGTAQDITDIKQVELDLLDALMLNGVTQAMATAANESTTLNEALNFSVRALLSLDDWDRAVAFRPVPTETGDDVLVPIELELPAPGVGAGSVEPTELDLDVAYRSLRAAAPVFEEERRPQNPSIAFPVYGSGSIAMIAVITAQTPFERHAMLRSMVDQVAGQLRRVVEREQAAIELSAARDAAMEASRLKSAFLATMSHEIRTPMNGVIGLNDLLLRTELDAHQRRLAEGVQGAGRGLLAIISDILDFSKIEAGKLELESVGFEVRPVFDQVATLLAESAREKGIELVVGVRPDVPQHLTGDPTRLRQVLSNLVSNAVKFTDTGEVVIRCGVESAEDDVVVLRVEVVDTGIGIDLDKQEQLFEPFLQVDSSTTRTHGGTGLGLAISCQLVAAIGGQIGVRSEPGVGSTFYFTGRFAVAEEAEVRPPRGECSHLLLGRRALVVDDNRSNRLIVGELLADWGLSVEESSGADQALERIRSAAGTGVPFEVVLLDLCMPGRDGFELAAMIRSAPDVPPLELLLLSSRDHVSAAALQEFDIAQCLLKPVSSSMLYDALVDCFAGDGRESMPPPSQHRAVTRGKHVLVVEDNEVNQMVALGVLEALGYSTDIAADGEIAVEMAAAGVYDAILMDVQMPRMDGYAATRAIRIREGAAAHVPIVAMTAAAIEGERDRCLASGMDDFLTKPLEPEVLESVLGQILRADLDLARLRMLEDMGEGAAGLVARAVHNFMMRAPEALQEIGAAIDRSSPEDLCASSHRLKGSAQNLGAVEVGRLCLELELLGRSGQTVGAANLLGDLERAMVRANEALHGYQRTLAP